MALADRVPRQWRAAWEQIAGDEVDILRDVIAWAETGRRWSTNRLAEEAGVHPYDVHNFVVNQHRRPGPRPGLRMLWFAARLKDETTTKPADILAKIETLNKIVDRLATFLPDDDYFFRHLQRLGVCDELDCKTVCDQISGHYYSHRLSRNPGKIIRSHYEFLKFTPFNRLPHVINRLRYGAVEDEDAVERTAEGQIVRLHDHYVLIGFVYEGYREAGKRPQDGVEYDGLQINLFPAGQMSRPALSVIDGLFLSYVYKQSYEMGRMKLLRKTKRGRLKFDPTQVGEFTLEQIHQMEPGLDLSGLKLDVSRLLDKEKGPTNKPDEALLATCLSFMLTREHLTNNQPNE